MHDKNEGDNDFYKNQQTYVYRAPIPRMTL